MNSEQITEIFQVLIQGHQHIFFNTIGKATKWGKFLSYQKWNWKVSGDELPKAVEAVGVTQKSKD